MASTSLFLSRDNRSAMQVSTPAEVLLRMQSIDTSSQPFLQLVRLGYVCLS